MTNPLYLVFANPTSDNVDDEFVRLYAEEHLAQSVSCDGWLSGTLYKAWQRPLDPQLAAFGVPPDRYQPPHRYLAVYEWASGNPQRQLDGMYEGVASGRLARHPHIDGRDFTNFVYLPVTDCVTRAEHR